MRKVAMAASAGNVKQEDFEEFWPALHKKKVDINMNTEEYKDWYRKMKVKNNLK